MKTNHATNQKIWAVTIQEENKQTNKQVFPLDLDYLLSIMNENVFEREREGGYLKNDNISSTVCIYRCIHAYLFNYKQKANKGKKGFYFNNTNYIDNNMKPSCVYRNLCLFVYICVYAKSRIIHTNNTFYTSILTIVIIVLIIIIKLG